MGWLRTFRCTMTHRNHWSFYGYGDWRIQKCSKCGDVWPVMAHRAIGPRIEPEELL